jgi:hypothetical protein
MGARGVGVRFLAGLASGLSCIVLVVACSGIAQRTAKPEASAAAVLGAGQTGGSWATEAELTWLRKLGAWDTRLLAGLRKAGEIEASPELVQELLRHDGPTSIAHSRALAVAETCSADLASRVGPPPTERLGPALAAFERACTHLRGFHTAILLAVLRGDSSLVREAQAEAARGGELLLEADHGLPPGEVRSLPVIGGVSAASRVEPRLGEVASWLSGKPVEVRCWSQADWIMLLREEKAYTKHRIDEDTLGFAGIDGTRINLAPDVCDGLVDLGYDHARPSSAAARFPLAAAVVTLAHEPQHTKGIAVEAQAECYAIQLAAATAGRLGVDRRYAAGLARLYWTHYGEELPAYRSPECRDGGAYDLRRANSVWP